MERLKQLIAALLVAYAGYLLLPPALTFWKAQRATAAAAYHDAASLSFEQRRVRIYGMCGATGYGYLRQVAAALPDQDSLPAVRYPDWDRGGLLPFPWHSRSEPRVLVGIGVPEVDFTERQMGGTSPDGRHDLGERVVDRMAFQTTVDWDSLTRWDFDLPVPLEQDETIEIVLHYSRLDDKVLGRWTIPVTHNQPSPVHFQLPQPILEFSHNRGATDFIVEVIRPKRMAPLRSLVPVGVRVVSVPGLKIVHRGPICFTAVAPDILEAAKQQPKGEWARFLDAVRKLHVD